MEAMRHRHKRNSSIELLKIFAILVIVISHVVQTLGTEGKGDFYINLSSATYSHQYLLISMLRYCGILGNTIFFVCSAWFFLDDSRANKKKVFIMLADIWVISIICLVIGSIYLKEIKKSLVLQSLFPTTFSNNWYLTCYIIFYLIHPYLNALIEGMSQKQLFRTAFWVMLLYIIISFTTQITKQLFNAQATFFSSELVLWGVLYFIIAYIKRYAPNLTNNLLLNTILIVVGCIGNCGIILLTNIIGLKYAPLSNSLQIWNRGNNPFILLIAIGAFNLAKSVKYESRLIDYVSGLSLYIYIIHENLILRLYIRPAIWQYIYTNFGYSHILGWVFMLAVLVFAFGLISSMLYKHTIHKLVCIISDTIYPKISNTWRHFEDNVLRKLTVFK